MKAYLCLDCGNAYNEEEGDLESGIEPDTPWDEVSAGWRCPGCGAAKEDFKRVEI